MDYLSKAFYKWNKNYSPIVEQEDGSIVSMRDLKNFKKRLAQLEMKNDILKSYSHIYNKTKKYDRRYVI